MYDCKNKLKIKCSLLSHFHFPYVLIAYDAKCPEFYIESDDNKFIIHLFLS